MEAERLRAAEKFMTVGTGEAECIQCGYLYDPRKGDPEYPVSPNTQFQVRASLSCSVGLGRCSTARGYSLSCRTL